MDSDQWSYSTPEQALARATALRTSARHDATNLWLHLLVPAQQVASRSDLTSSERLDWMSVILRLLDEAVAANGLPPWEAAERADAIRAIVIASLGPDRDDADRDPDTLWRIFLDSVPMTYEETRRRAELHGQRLRSGDPDIESLRQLRRIKNRVRPLLPLASLCTTTRAEAERWSSLAGQIP